MTHEVYWLNPGKVLYAGFKGHQTAETFGACMDDQLIELDAVDQPVVVMADWSQVVEIDRDTIKKQQGHRAYGHPMVARVVIVGIGTHEALFNEINNTQARDHSHARYFHTMEEAREYLKHMLDDSTG